MLRDYNLYQFSRLLDKLINDRYIIFKDEQHIKSVLTEEKYVYLMSLLREEFKNLNLYYEEEEQWN